jgi:hypothetical protein
MATAAIRKLDLEVGEIVEVDGKRYEVVGSRDGETLWLEPAVVPMDELHEMRGTKPVSQEEFDRLSAGLPTDDDQSGER